MQVVSGLKSIAVALGVSESTAVKYARLPVDRLPLRELKGHVWGYDGRIEEWRQRREDLDAWRTRRPRGEPGLPHIVGWLEIAAAIAVGVSVRTAQRWATRKDDPLPVIGQERYSDRIEGKVWLYAGALRDWCQRNDAAYSRPPGRCCQRAVASVQLTLFG